MKKLVLLLNMGGASSLDDVKIFLTNMFNDECILGIKNRFLRKIVAYFIIKSRLKQAQKNYSKIGGKSPIAELSESLVDKLNSQQFGEIKFDFAMNYTPPFVEDVLRKYTDYEEIVLFPLYPHHSITTITSSLKSFARAYKALNLKAKLSAVEPFYKNDDYNEILIEKILDKLDFEDEIEGDISLIFSAHSLPQKIIDNGDIYEKQIKEHVRILKQKLQQKEIVFKEILLAYQSKLGPVKWLGPNLSDVLTNLESKKALICPLSFCIDNSETAFELSIEYAKIAKAQNFTYYNVCQCPNDDHSFVNFIQKSVANII
ncbi:MAG: ferrochelatase [Campylobacter sp.]|nr:ferrochelatase [Campylobacter sp.]